MNFDAQRRASPERFRAPVPTGPPLAGAKGRGAGWRRSALSPALALLVVFLPSVRAAAQIPSHAAWGQPVVGIRLESNAQQRVDDFAAQITVKKGAPLDAAQVRECLKNLYATGRFSELRAELEPESNGVVLVFVAKAQFFVGLVRAEGAPKHISAAALVGASRLRLGQPLNEDVLSAAEARVAAVLRDEGYYGAKVSSRPEAHPDDQEADVVFRIDPGAAALLSGVETEGPAYLAPGRLEAIAGWHAGTQLTSSRLERGLARLRHYYLKHGRLAISLQAERRIPDPKSNTDRLVLKVEAGPVVKVRVRGARVSTSKLKEILPVYSEGLTDDLALAAGQHNLEDYLQRQGYFRATVTWRRDPSAGGGELDIIYQVERRRRGRFAGYAFNGNQLLPAETLALLLEIRPPRLRHSRGLFSNQLLQHDVQALTSLYQARGFLEARVTPHLDDHYGNEAGSLFVTFQIDKGDATRVNRLTISGVDPQTEKRLRAILTVQAGQPYSPSRADSDRDAILNYFASQGYNQATMRWKAAPVAADHKVDLEYVIQTGRQERVQRLVVMGNRHTRLGGIQRAVTLQQGKPLNQNDVFESQRQLYNLGLFNQVQIGPQDPEAEEAEKTVLVNVEEAHRWSVGYGGGIDLQRLENTVPQGKYQGSPRLSLDLTRIGVGGRDQTFSMRGRLSNLETGGALTYSIPHFLNRHDLNLRFNALDDQTRDVLTFTDRRMEASVILEERRSATTYILGRYTYRREAPTITNNSLSPEELPLASQPARVAGFGLTYVNDHRDDPADATKGSYTLVDAAVAYNKLGSQANFLRLSGQNSTYYRLRPNIIFARNTRLGLESSFGAPRRVAVPGGFALTDQIPLPEKLFMGGSESHRGFALNQAGPRDPITGYPIGGNSLFLNSLELRFRAEEGHYGFVLFHDAGNGYSSVRRMRLLKFTENSPTDLDYTVHAVGAGFRYRTPIGPLRFDVGYDLNPPRYQVCAQQVQVCPPQSVEVRQLSRFQFSLSIGQIF